jgi:hypothetical protein
VQAGPDAVYCHRRCADLELIDRLAVIRASVSAAAVLDALPDDDCTFETVVQHGRGPAHGGFGRDPTISSSRQSVGPM